MRENLKAHIHRETIISGVLNAVLNGLIIWLLKKDSVVIPFEGDTGFAGDIAVTAFLLLFCVAAIVIGLQRKKLEKGELASFRWDTTSVLERFLARMPRSSWRSGLLFGLFGLFIVTPLTLLPMSLLGITEMTPLTYTLFKGIWAGGLAALITPSVIMLALAEERVIGIEPGIE